MAAEAINSPLVECRLKAERVMPRTFDASDGISDKTDGTRAPMAYGLLYAVGSENDRASTYARPRAAA